MTGATSSFQVLFPDGHSETRYFGIIAMGWATILFVIVATQTVSFYWVGLCAR